MPEVSVIIATFNRGAFLEEAIRSAASQTYKDREIIVADDGSTDDTLERLSRYGNGVKVLSLEHTGRPSVVRNAAIAAATGRLLAFLDSDDLWAPGKLETQVRLLDQNPSFVMCYSDADFLNHSGKSLGRQSRREKLKSGNICGDLLQGNFIPFSTVVVRREVLEDVRRFDERLTMAEDWHLWVKVAARGEVGLVRDVLCTMRVLACALTGDKMFLFEEALQAIRYLESELPEEFRKYRPQVRRGRAKMLAMLGRNRLFSGQTGDARRLFSEALGSWPFRLDVVPFYALACLGRRTVLGARSLKKAIWH
ncbi:MAG: glycosyltransferase [Candidatus Eiseniibacteriota bacterium]|nr:MAG: glycosyltransferase [Candidatus Eisenbacteria bacterium]